MEHLHSNPLTTAWVSGVSINKPQPGSTHTHESAGRLATRRKEASGLRTQQNSLLAQPGGLARVAEDKPNQSKRHASQPFAENSSHGQVNANGKRRHVAKNDPDQTEPRRNRVRPAPQSKPEELGVAQALESSHSTTAPVNAAKPLNHEDMSQSQMYCSCKICNKTFASEITHSNYQKHIQSKAHQERVAALRGSQGDNHNLGRQMTAEGVQPVKKANANHENRTHSGIISDTPTRNQIQVVIPPRASGTSDSASKARLGALTAQGDETRQRDHYTNRNVKSRPARNAQETTAAAITSTDHGSNAASETDAIYDGDGEPLTVPKGWVVLFPLNLRRA